MTDIYQGDPRIFIDENGAYLNFVGGQPTMDRGLENLAIISLFTRLGWAGNVLFDDTNQQIGSDFEEIANQPITFEMLNDLRNAAERALDNPAFGTVTATINNPSGHRLEITVLIEPPGQDVQMLLLTKNGLNWRSQALDPAYKRE